MSAANKQIVEQVNTAFQQGNNEGFLSLCTEDVRWNMIGDNIPAGKEAIRKFLENGPAEPPRFSVKNMIAEGSIVMCNGDVTMKNAVNENEEYAYCDVYEIRDGKVAVLTSYVVKYPAKTTSENS